MNDDIDHRRPLYPTDPRRRLDAIIFNTSAAAELAERVCRAVDEYRIDARKEERLKRCECSSCFYLRSYRLSVGYSSTNCRACDKKIMHQGFPPDVCEECSKRYRICRICGGDLEGRQGRRTLEPAQKQPR